MKLIVLKKNGGASQALSVDEASSQISKLSQQIQTIDNPSIDELKTICQEHDVYLLDRLAKDLYGIQDLSLHIDKIKEILSTKE